MPHRISALRTEEELLRLVRPHFELVDFHRVTLKADDLYIRSLTLRNARRNSSVSA